MDTGQRAPTRPGYYSWHVTGKSISIDLSGAAAAQARQLLSGEGLSGGARSIENGGLLLGTVQEYGERTLVSVEAIEIVPSEHCRGESWTLSKRDKLTFYRKLRGLSGKLSPVGFVRTHSRKGLYLDNYDLDLMRTFFSAAHSVALIVRPDEDAQSGFFFWESGDMQRSRPYQTFSLTGVRGPQALPRATAVPPTVAKPRGMFDWRWAAAPLALGLVLLVPSYFHSTQSPEADEQEAAAVVAESTVEPVVPARTILPVGLEQPLPSPKPVASAHPVPDEGTRGRKVDASIHPPTRQKPAVESTVLPAKESVVRKVFGHVPGLGKLRRAEENFIEPRAIYRRSPSLMRNERAAVRVRVDETGSVRGAWLAGSNPDAAFSAAALDAAKHWRFEPARKNGKPVESSLVIQFAPTQRASASSDMPLRPRRPAL